MIRRFIASALLALLAACGGGGSGEPFQPPAIRTSGQLTADKAYVFVEVFGKQDAKPWTVSMSLRAGATYYPMDFKDALICVREYGSTRPCGSTGTLTYRIPSTAGGDFVFDVSNLPSVRSLGWGQTLVLELVIDYYPDYWQPGDFFTVTVTGITFDYDGDTESVSYIGYPGSSVTLARGTPRIITLSPLGVVSKKRNAPNKRGVLAYYSLR